MKTITLRFMVATVMLIPFIISSCSKDPQDMSDKHGVFTGYTYSTTNFVEGWNATIKDNFVEVSDANTTVLLHYGVILTDALRIDIINNCWTLLAGSRYTVIKLYPYNYSALNFPYNYLQADVTDKATGKTKFVSFVVQVLSGVAYGYEVISNSSAEFQQKFQTIESIENMYGFNKFAMGTNDLIGIWQEGGGAFTQYYYVQSGNYAGMNITVSNLKYTFVNSTAYNTDVKSVSNGGYSKEKEIGSYLTSNWDVSTTDQNGKVSQFNAWFEAVKGGRILHLWDKQNTGEHFQLGRIN